MENKRIKNVKIHENLMKLIESGKINKKTIIKSSLSIITAATMVIGSSSCRKNPGSDISSDSSASYVSSNITSNDDTELEIDTNSEISDQASEITGSSNSNSSSKKATTSSNSNSSSKKTTTSSKENNSSKQNSQTNNYTNSNDNIESSNPTELVSSNFLVPFTTNNINNMDVLKNNARFMFMIDGAFISNLSYHYKDQIYKAGENEYLTAIALLNESYMTNETIADIIGDNSFETIKRYGQVMGALFYSVGSRQVKLDFDKLVINSKKKAYLNKIQNNVYELVNNSNSNSLETLVGNYYNKIGSDYNLGDDGVIDMFVYYAGYYCKDYFKDNNVIESVLFSQTEIYDNYSSEISKLYQRDKSKVLQK